jgi:hypothetical protein
VFRGHHTCAAHAVRPRMDVSTSPDALLTRSASTETPLARLLVPNTCPQTARPPHHSNLTHSPHIQLFRAGQGACRDTGTHADEASLCVAGKGGIKCRFGNNKAMLHDAAGRLPLQQKRVAEGGMHLAITSGTNRIDQGNCSWNFVKSAARAVPDFRAFGVGCRAGRRAWCAGVFYGCMHAMCFPWLFTAIRRWGSAGKPVFVPVTSQQVLTGRHPRFPFSGKSGYIVFMRCGACQDPCKKSGDAMRRLTCVPAWRACCKGWHCCC